MKILLVSEFTGLGSTGYSVYYKEIAKSLHEAGHEIIELASYGDNNLASHVRYQRTCPWKVILNQPRRDSANDIEAYRARESATGDAKFGSWAFDIIVAQEQPDIVLAVRDHWYDKFIIDSPAAEYYVSVLSPTVDAMPQKSDWIDTFGRVDYITAYNEWSENWLKKQYRSHNVVKFVSPSADSAYKPMSKSSCRKELGIPTNIKLVGTVMRNQRRKKFAHLFEAVEKCPDVYLYCHTAYPDRGWDIPTLLLQTNIAHKTFLTYMCGKCGHYEAKLYSTRSPICERCKEKMETPSSRKGLTNNQLAKVYNSMDLYIQLHNSEGLGIPVLEAAKCGVKVLTVDYSAQEDVGRRIGAEMMKPHSLDTEIETGCKRAIPDVDLLVNLLNSEDTYKYNPNAIISEYNKNYSWEMTGKKWVDIINSIKPKNKWNTNPVVRQPIEFDQLNRLNLSNSDFLLACVLNVAHDAKLLGSYMHTELLDCLNSGFQIFPDGNMIGVDRQSIYRRFRAIIDRKNSWEKERHRIREKFLTSQK